MIAKMMLALVVGSMLVGAETSEQKVDSKITVGGQVRKPGEVAHTEDMTLHEAIQMAEGTTEFASLKRVTIYREGKATRHDVTTEAGMKIPVQPDDVIDVPMKATMCE